MIFKNNKVIIGIVSCFILVSSGSSIASFIKIHNFKNSKNTISLNITNSSNNEKILNNKSIESVTSLLNNLNYIYRYINSTVIIKEKLLRLSILGGLYDNTAKYKNDKKRKSSELAQFSNALKHVHRYADQTRATIDNSINSLDKESGVISQIISIVKDHPYTYNFYLEMKKVSIPNIGFFIKSHASTSFNNLDLKTSDITNNSYGINTNNTNLNNIAFSSEEDAVNAHTICADGSSIYAAAFKKITFQAAIITFNNTLNSFEYETPTAVEKINNITPSSAQLNSETSEISNVNYLKKSNSSYFYKSSTILSVLNSSLNNEYDLFRQVLPVPEIPNYLPDYFKKNILNVANAKVQYNKISEFNNNKSLYIPAIVFGPDLIAAIGLIIGHFIVYKWTKHKIRVRIRKGDLVVQNKDISDTINEKLAAADRIYTIEKVSNIVTIKEAIDLTEECQATYNSIELEADKGTFQNRTEKTALLTEIVKTRSTKVRMIYQKKEEINFLETDKIAQSEKKDNILAMIKKYNDSDKELINNCKNQEELDELTNNFIKDINDKINIATNLTQLHQEERNELIRQLNEIKDDVVTRKNLKKDEIDTANITRQTAIESERRKAWEETTEKIFIAENTRREENKNESIRRIEDLVEFINSQNNENINNEKDLSDWTNIIKDKVIQVDEFLKKQNYKSKIDRTEVNERFNILFTLSEHKINRATEKLKLKTDKIWLESFLDNEIKHINNSILYLPNITKIREINNKMNSIEDEVNRIIKRINTESKLLGNISLTRYKEQIGLIRDKYVQLGDKTKAEVQSQYSSLLKAQLQNLKEKKDELAKHTLTRPEETNIWAMKMHNNKTLKLENNILKINSNIEDANNILDCGEGFNGFGEEIVLFIC